METIPERLEPVVVDETVADDAPVNVADAPAAAIDEPLVRSRARRRRRAFELTVTRQDVLAVLAVYFATRVLLLLAAYLLSAFGHHNFLHELANWDGLWYREVANNGYLNHPSFRQTTLGFFPLYPLTIWIVEPVFTLLTAHGAIWAATVAGVVISMIGGAITTYLVYRLATEWWDRKTGFRAAVLFAVFPGSVVFSMVYSEGLLLPLAAGCLLALGHRRWLVAGILAGFATAVQPVAIVLVAACAVAAFIEWRRSGWQRPVLRRVIVAPLLSLTGICAFGAFLWAWTGTPLANYEAQHHGWSEKTDLLAMLHLTTRLFAEITHEHPEHKAGRHEPDCWPGGRNPADRDAGARLAPAPSDPARGARLDGRDQLPGAHLGVRAAATETADHRVPGADGRAPVRAPQVVADSALDELRAARGAEPVHVLWGDAAALTAERAGAGADAPHPPTAETPTAAQPRRRRSSWMWIAAAYPSCTTRACPNARSSLPRSCRNRARLASDCAGPSV